MSWSLSKIFSTCYFLVSLFPFFFAPPGIDGYRVEHDIYVFFFKKIKKLEGVPSSLQGKE